MTYEPVHNLSEAQQSPFHHDRLGDCGQVRMPLDPIQDRVTLLQRPRDLYLYSTAALYNDTAKA